MSSATGKRKRTAENSLTRPVAAKHARSTSGKSREVKDLVDEDDARIAQLEKKLGIKNRKTSQLKSFKDDGLDDLLRDLSDDEAGGESAEKDRGEYDEWLAQKRGLAKGPQKPGHDRLSDEEPSGSESDSDLDHEDEYSSGTEGGDDAWEGCSDDDLAYESDGGSPVEDAPPKRERENPYVAPVAGSASTTKYVPPAMKRAAGSEDTTALKRKLQGLLNRLTESNIQGIVRDVEKVYASTSRGNATEALMEVIMAQVADAATLSESFFVLYGGFVAALYRIVGESFASHLVTRVVGDFKQAYASAGTGEVQGSKVTSNLVTFVSELYVLEVVGSGLIFDFIRLLIGELSELNTELLLRVVRSSGKLLRKDDPQALKDIVSRLRSLIAAANGSDVSVRTKFMVDTITDLKNNKQRAGQQESAAVTERMRTIKKFLGGLGSQGHSQNGPLRIGLKDIEESETRGKWWLVGASFGGNVAQAADAKPEDEPKRKHAAPAASPEDSDLERFCPDYIKVARQQGLNTDVQQAIFSAIVGTNNAKEAYDRYLKINLNKHQRREIATVLMVAAAAEHPYNPWYAKVADKACADRKIRFAFQDRLWQYFRQLGESLFGEEGGGGAEDEGELAFGLDDSRIVNIGQMIGGLVASSSLSIKVLKPLDIPSMNGKTGILLEQIVVAIFRGCAKDKSREKLGAIFREATSDTILAAGLHYFLKKLPKTMRAAKRVKKRDVAGLEEECAFACSVLEAAVTSKRAARNDI